MRLSARNQIKGVVVNLQKGATTSQVEIEVAKGLIMTASITNESVETLGLRVGEPAWAVIKASSVMVGVD